MFEINRGEKSEVVINDTFLNLLTYGSATPMLPQWRIQDLSKGADHGERAEREPKRGSVAEPPAESRGRAPGGGGGGGRPPSPPIAGSATVLPDGHYILLLWFTSVFQP